MMVEATTLAALPTALPVSPTAGIRPIQKMCPYYAFEMSFSFKEFVVDVGNELEPIFV